MEDCSGKYDLKPLLVYLDVVITPISVSQGAERLSELFEKFRKMKLKPKPTMCTLFQQRVAFLSHCV